MKDSSELIKVVKDLEIEKELLLKKIYKLKIQNKNLIKNVENFIPHKYKKYEVRNEFSHLEFSYAAIQKLIDDYCFDTVLDIGAGSLDHSRIFAQHNKYVTAIDLGNSVYFKEGENKEEKNIRKIIGNFNDIVLDESFDLVWASHILEHQPNVDFFLKKLIGLTKENGIIAITVPPFKHKIVGGHVSLWNAGLVLYRLILCGLNCKDAAILSYDYNISIIVKKESINLEGLEYDCGDIRKIQPYLPSGLKYYSNSLDEPFEGNISHLNW